MADGNKPAPNEAMCEVLGRNVQRLRREQRFNKKLFACMCGIGRPLLDRIERGESDVRLSYVQRLADALAVAPVDLLTAHDDAGEQHGGRTRDSRARDPHGQVFPGGAPMP